VKISQTGVALVALPLLFLFGVLACEMVLLNSEEKLLQSEARSRRVTALSSDIAALALNCRAAVALYQSDNQAANQALLGRAEKQLVDNLDLLRQVAASDPVETEYAASIDDLSRQLISQCKETANQKDKAIDANAHAHLAQLGHDIDSKVDAMRMRELYLTGNKPSELIAFREKFQTLISCTAILSIVVAIGVSILFTRQIASRLNQLRENAHRLAKDEPLHEVLSGDDEIAFVDRSFHSTYDALKEATNMRQEFVSMITHDLRSPLTSISLVLQGLRYGLHGELTDDAVHAAEAAGVSAERLLRLIDQLLLYERIASGALTLNYEKFDLMKAVDESINSVRSLADQSQVKIEFHAGEPITIEADHDRVVQVLVNLLSNAIKFSSTGQNIDVRVSCDASQQACVEVADHGRGIAQEQAAGIFDKYKQTSQQDAKLGAGLGLFICKGIIESHKGKIGVESTEGQGSKFWFILPQMR
jgi:signal transduction histidine kinase